MLVADDAPQSKLTAIRRLKARLIKTPWSKVLEVCSTKRYRGMNGLFIHPFSDPSVMAGNATIGLEIIENLPDVNTVIIPYGGGGLSCAIASVIRSLKTNTKIYACEVETDAPAAASFANGKPTEVNQIPTFVSGIGSPLVFDEMWPLATTLLDGSLVTKIENVTNAIRLLIEQNHIVVEGAGAAPVAAALTRSTGPEYTACVISGGNIDTDKLVKILRGKTP